MSQTIDVFQKKKEKQKESISELSDFIRMYAMKESFQKKPLVEDPDFEARIRNLYGFRILRCAENRRVEITTPQGPRWVVDYATNGPFALNVRNEVVQGSIRAIQDFGALHTSIASARAQTGLASIIAEMEANADRTIVTGSFGKTFGAAGGFLVGPASFIEHVLSVSTADRFSCNLDVSAQGAVLAAMQVLSRQEELKSLQDQLAARLVRLDDVLLSEGIQTEQTGTPIAYRVVPFDGPIQGIHAASHLLEQFGILTTPVYYPTIARGKGAIRISLSVGHKSTDIDDLVAALVPLLKPGAKATKKEFS